MANEADLQPPKEHHWTRCRCARTELETVDVDLLQPVIVIGPVCISDRDIGLTVLGDDPLRAGLHLISQFGHSRPGSGFRAPVVGTSSIIA